MDKPMLAGVYRHYSSLMVLVLGVARHSETEEKFVVYVPLGAKEGPRLTVRPLAMFFEDVEVGNQKQPRFKFIGSEIPTDLAAQYKSTKNWGQAG
jgi:hypothetical protein